MDQTVNVAVVRGDNRRGAVAEALALIADDLRDCVTPHVLIKPNLVSHRVQLPSTHADTLSATLDAVLAAGAAAVTVAEGASDATAGFERFGYHREAWGRPVRFLDLNRDETEWEPLELTGVDGAPLTARLSRTIARPTCRVSLALAKTHVTSMVTLSLKNMLSSIHPADRIMMHGHAGGGNGYRGWKRPGRRVPQGRQPGGQRADPAHGPGQERAATPARGRTRRPRPVRGARSRRSWPTSARSRR